MVLGLCACEEKDCKDHLFLTVFRTCKLSIRKPTLSTILSPRVFRKVKRVGYKPNFVPFTLIIFKDLELKRDRRLPGRN